MLHLTESQTETDAFVGDRICACACVCACVCVCARALPPQIDSSATCAQLQLPTDGGGIREGDSRSDRERQKERKGESGRDGEK